MLAENDSNRDGVISFTEFIDMMIKVKGTNDKAFGEIATGADGTAVARIENEHGGKH